MQNPPSAETRASLREALGGALLSAQDGPFQENENQGTNSRRVLGDEYFIDNRMAGLMRVREDAGLLRIQSKRERAEDISDQNGSQ